MRASPPRRERFDRRDHVRSRAIGSRVSRSATSVSRARADPHPARDFFIHAGDAPFSIASSPSRRGYTFRCPRPARRHAGSLRLCERRSCGARGPSRAALRARAAPVRRRASAARVVAAADASGWSDSTQAVHHGERGGRPRVSDSLTTPVCMTSTYWFKDSEELIAYQEGDYGSFEYGRYGNPTSRACEEDPPPGGRRTALLSASGMNSAICMLLALVPAGGHIVTTTDCYRRTRQFVQTFMPKMGISCTVLDPSDYDGLEKALEEHDCSLYFSESPTNPYLRCVDIERISKLCKPKGCLVCIDGTFATPVNSRALEFGADLVIHSVQVFRRAQRRPRGVHRGR